MYISLLAGTDPKKLVLNGSNKQDEELEMAISNGLCINIDSMDELERISQIAKKLNKSVDVGIRLALDLDPLYRPMMTLTLLSLRLSAWAEIQKY